MKQTTRVQLELGAEVRARLDRLKDVTEAASYTDVIKNALRLYEGIIDEGGHDAKLVVHRPDGTTAIVRIFA